MNFFDPTDDREEKRRNQWLKTQIAKAWQNHLIDERNHPPSYDTFNMDRVAQRLLDDAPRWPWSTPTDAQKADWVDMLKSIVGTMIYQPGNPEYLSNTDRTVRLHLLSDDDSYSGRFQGFLMLKKLRIGLQENQVQSLLDVINRKKAADAQHFAQTMPRMFEEARRPALIAQWERDATLNQALREKEELEREIYRNARRSPTNAPSTDSDDDRRSDNGGWNALGTSYIGGSGNPYDSWSP